MKCHKPEEQKAELDLSMNLYEMNKQMIAQCPPLDNEQLDNAIETITTYARGSDNIYHMLLCQDINYYTLFKIGLLNDKAGGFAELVLECASDIGAIKAVDTADGGALEIWVHPVCEEQPIVMYLFPYDQGVVECTL